MFWRVCVLDVLRPGAVSPRLFVVAMAGVRETTYRRY